MNFLRAEVADADGGLALGGEGYQVKVPEDRAEALALALEGLEPDEERCKELIEQSLAMCTSLAPAIGYDKAAALAKKAFTEGRTVREVAESENVLPKDELERLLDPEAMTHPS